MAGATCRRGLYHLVFSMATVTDHYRICCSCKEWYPVRWRLTKWSEPCDSNVFCRDCARIIGCVTPLDRFKYGGNWYASTGAIR